MGLSDALDKAGRRTPDQCAVATKVLPALEPGDEDDIAQHFKEGKPANTVIRVLKAERNVSIGRETLIRHFGGTCICNES